MDLSIYLAMTGAEISSAGTGSRKTAYLSCHFSPYGTGLSGIPRALPPGSMLLLTDRTPVAGHDPERVARELEAAAVRLGCSRVALDLQRQGCDQTQKICREVIRQLSLPVGVSECYARELDCPVLVSPPPLWTPLERHLAPWQGREVWLEAVTEDAVATLTREGNRLEPSPVHDDCPFADQALCIRYRIRVEDDRVQFLLHRGKGELAALLRQAKELGVETALGLYQQLGEDGLQLCGDICKGDRDCHGRKAPSQ